MNCENIPMTKNMFNEMLHVQSNSTSSMTHISQLSRTYAGTRTSFNKDHIIHIRKKMTKFLATAALVIQPNGAEVDLAVFSIPDALSRSEKSWDEEARSNGPCGQGNMKSQYGQDAIVARMFHSWHPLAGQNHKRYIEVGAADGLSYSNSFFFQVCMNWDGLLMEPHGEAFKELVYSRRERPMMIGPFPKCVNKCGGNKFNETLPFLQLVNKGQRAVGGVQLASCLAEEADADHMQNLDDSLRRFGGQMKVVDVHCERVSTELDELGWRKVDYMSVDTEGHEMNVLEGIEFGNHFFDVISLEMRSDKDVGNPQRIKDVLEREGMIPVAQSGLSRGGDLIFAKVGPSRFLDCIGSDLEFLREVFINNWDHFEAMQRRFGETPAQFDLDASVCIVGYMVLRTWTFSTRVYDQSQERVTDAFTGSHFDKIDDPHWFQQIARQRFRDFGYLWWMIGKHVAWPSNLNAHNAYLF